MYFVEQIYTFVWIVLTCHADSRSNRLQIHFEHTSASPFQRVVSMPFYYCFRCSFSIVSFARYTQAHVISVPFQCQMPRKRVKDAPKFIKAHKNESTLILILFCCLTSTSKKLYQYYYEGSASNCLIWLFYVIAGIWGQTKSLFSLFTRPNGIYAVIWLCLVAKNGIASTPRPLSQTVTENLPIFFCFLMHVLVFGMDTKSYSFSFSFICRIIKMVYIVQYINCL